MNIEVFGRNRVFNTDSLVAFKSKDLKSVYIEFGQGENFGYIKLSAEEFDAIKTCVDEAALQGSSEFKDRFEEDESSWPFK